MLYIIFEEMKWLFYFFLGFSLCLHAQEPSHVILGEEDLAGVNVYSMLQDVDNSVLLSTNNGVYRYNSLKFELLASKSVGDMSIFGLTKSPKNEIYCYNLSGQIFKVQKNALQPYFQIPKGLLSNNIYLGFDQLGNLLISCKELLLIQKEKLIKRIYAFSDGYAACLTNDSSWKLYFSNRNVLFQWSNGKLTKIHFFQKTFLNLLKPYAFLNNHVNFIIDTKAKGLYKTTNGYQEITYVSPKDGSEIFHVMHSKKQELLWIGSSKNGVYCSKADGKSLFNGERLFRDYFISSHLEDNEGNIWLSTFGKGIIFIPNLDIIDYANHPIVKEDDLLRLSKKGDVIYFGGAKGDLYQLQQEVIAKASSGHRRIEFLKYEPISNLFFVNDKVFNTNFQEMAQHRFNKYDVIVDPKKHFLFTTREGLFRWKQVGVEPQSLGYSIRSYALVQDDLGSIWLGSSTGLEHEQNGKFSKILYQGKPIFSTSIIKVNRQIWVASSSGILVFEKGKLQKVYTTASGLLSNNPYKLLFREGCVYISHHQGIQKWDIRTQQFVNFTKVDGLLSNAIIDFEVVDSFVYLITPKGLQKINFSKPIQLPPLPKVLLQDWKVNGLERAISEKTLQPDENTLEFQVLAISHKYRDKLKYQYTLEGYENNWRLGDFSSDKITYQQLPSGQYSFLIRPFFNGKVGAVTRHSFEIETVFWKKKSFLIICFILALALLFWVYNFRINLLVKRKNAEIEKERYQQEINASKLVALKSQMNPHFMFNALNSIQDFILHNQKELASDYLADFADLMRGYLNHSQEDKISLHDEVSLLNLYLKLEKVRFEEEFTYEIHVDEKLDPDQVCIPSFLIQPFVENAMKHGLLHKKAAKKLKVTFYPISAQVLCCEIEDNGVGRAYSAEMNKNKKYKSFATKASLHRLELLNSNAVEKIALQIIDLTDDAHQSLGTKVIITIPILP